MRMAAIYARVSSEQQREAHTIASQTAVLIEFAKGHNLEVPKEWVFEDEGYSGATLVRAFYLNVCLVNPVALVHRLQMRAATFIQLGRTCLHPTPNATGVHLDSSFSHQFGDMFVRKRITKVQAHARDDQFSRVLPSFEWIIRGDRHRVRPTNLPRFQVRNGTRETVLLSRFLHPINFSHLLLGVHANFVRIRIGRAWRR